jgi:hypothetical protein
MSAGDTPPVRSRVLLSTNGQGHNDKRQGLPLLPAGQSPQTLQLQPAAINIPHHHLPTYRTHQPGWPAASLATCYSYRQDIMMAEDHTTLRHHPCRLRQSSVRWMDFPFQCQPSSHPTEGPNLAVPQAAERRPVSPGSRRRLVRPSSLGDVRRPLYFPQGQQFFTSRGCVWLTTHPTRQYVDITESPTLCFIEEAAKPHGGLHITHTDMPQLCTSPINLARGVVASTLCAGPPRRDSAAAGYPLRQAFPLRE